MTFRIEPPVPKNMDVEQLDTERKVMNKIMMNYVEQVKAEPNKFVQNRSAIDRLLNRSPFNPNEKKNYPIMFRDKWNSFTSLFLQGMDFDFLMLYVCILSFLEQVARRDSAV
jgi:hypothetical protein